MARSAPSAVGSRNALSVAGEDDADNPLTPMGRHRVRIHTAMVATGLRYRPLDLSVTPYRRELVPRSAEVSCGEIIEPRWWAAGRVHPTHSR